MGFKGLIFLAPVFHWAKVTPALYRDGNRWAKRRFVTVVVSVVRVWTHREVAGPLAVLADKVMSDGRRGVITGHGHR